MNLFKILSVAILAAPLAVVACAVDTGGGEGPAASDESVGEAGGELVTVAAACGGGAGSCKGQCVQTYKCCFVSGGTPAECKSDRDSCFKDCVPRTPPPPPQCHLSTCSN